MRDGYSSELRIFKPTGSSPAKGPLFILMYGGGFMVGNNKSFAPTAKALVLLYGATVVNLSYRLAPTYKFPTAPRDAYDTLLWVSENFDTLGADAAKGFVVGGASAGSNLAAAAVQKWLLEKQSPPVTGMWLSVPSVLAEPIVPEKYKDLYISREQNADALILNKAAIDRVTEAYVPDIFSPEYSPFNVEGAHTGMPPTYLQVNGADPLRDDGLVYEKVLREHGVKTKIDVYPGMPHITALFPHLKMAQKSSVDSLMGLGWLVGEESDEDVVKRVLALTKPT